MREIKFRAWDKENKEMAYFPDLIFGNDGLLETLKHESWMGDCEPENYTPEVDGYHDADKFELMQFTGLHDKNGKEIWEGDIVGFGKGGVGRVVNGLDLKDGYNNPNYFGFLIRYGRANYLFEWAKTLPIEVLGNIYEHPHLLREEEGK